MKAQRQANGLTGAATQPMSANSLSGGFALEGLPKGVSCASVSGMRRINTSGTATGTAQPCSSAVVSYGIAPIRLLELRHKADGDTLDSMTTTQDRTTTTHSSTVAKPYGLGNPSSSLAESTSSPCQASMRLYTRTSTKLHPATTAAGLRIEQLPNGSQILEKLCGHESAGTNGWRSQKKLISFLI